MGWGGHIYLDGTGTERKPYDCHLGLPYVQQPGIVVQKSLKMEGFRATPHIVCFDGFHFIKRSTSQALSVTLSGILFRQTPLKFQDCGILTISNCSFEDTSIALSILVTNNSIMHLYIQRSSFFKNNTSSVEIALRKGDILVSNQSLVININETMFWKNGFHKWRFPKGVVTIKSVDIRPSRKYVQIFFFNITSVENYGHFVNLDLPSAFTDEEYHDVRLFNNTISDLVSKSTGREAHQVVNSLYNSNTKKTCVNFSNLRCSHNHLLRCIKIHSEEAEVEIQNSSFVGQQLLNERGGAIFFNTTLRGSIAIFNSRFRRNIAKGGGAVFANNENGTLSLNITKVNFTECAAARNRSGCAILVGEQKAGITENATGTHKLIANFREIRMRDCFGFQGQCDVVSLVLYNGKVFINESSWQNNIRSMGGALTVVNTGGNSDVVILSCRFVRNVASRNSVVTVVAQNFKGQAGNITVANSVLSNQRAGEATALTMNSNFRIKLIDTVLTLYERALAIRGSWPNASFNTYPFFISIYNCTFLNNFRDIVASSPDPTNVKVTIKNTSFTSTQVIPKSFGLSIIIFPLRRLNSSDAIIELDNVTFASKPCNIIGLLFTGNKTLRIKRSSFLHGVCEQTYYWTGIYTVHDVHEISTGAISVVAVPDKKRCLGCVKERPEGDIHPLWYYQSHATFEDTLFEGNGGFIAGAVYLCHGNTSFERCTFRNNFAVENSGHVYSADGTGQVNFKDCIFSSTIMNMTTNNNTFHKRTFLQSESGGPVNIQNTSMVSFAGGRNLYSLLDISNGGYVHMDDNSSVQCPIGSRLYLDNTTHFVYTEQNHIVCRINVTVLKYSCHRCSPGLYSIQKGVSRGLFVNSTVECLLCPFGASCIDRNIAAKPNFWGYPTSSDPPSVKFVTCPEHYCKKPTSETLGYNSCKGNRTDTLCGKCAEGYSETLFSTECRQDEECNNYWFGILTILLTTGLALYLLVKPPILGFLANQILWFKIKEDNLEKDDLGCAHQQSGADSGYIKITFYFYQAAELLMVGSIERVFEKIPYIYTLISAFNFRVRTVDNAIGCPFVGMTAVTKQLVLSSTVFVTMADIVLIYYVHYVFNKLRRKRKPALIHYMAVVMEVLLLGYERLAETSLTLMHCVSIGSRRWLFIDANVPCMQWWQYFLLAYITVFVVPFIIVLYCGSSKLYSSLITAREFLAACVLPLPFLIFWLFKKKQKQTGENSTRLHALNRDVLEILHGPFRPPSNQDKGTLYWESVLIGRRFILLACHSFIRRSMLRMVSMAAACFLMTIHHVLKNPFHEVLANKAETLSLSTLTMIAIINLTKATIMSFGITIDGPYRSYLDTLEWFEVLALAFVPVFLSGLVAFAILSQLTRLAVFLIKQIIGCSRRRLTEQRRPLLDISEYHYSQF